MRGEKQIRQCTSIYEYARQTAKRRGAVVMRAKQCERETREAEEEEKSVCAEDTKSKVIYIFYTESFLGWLYFCFHCLGPYFYSVQDVNIFFFFLKSILAVITIVDSYFFSPCFVSLCSLSLLVYIFIIGFFINAIKFYTQPRIHTHLHVYCIKWIIKFFFVSQIITIKTTRMDETSKKRTHQIKQLIFIIIFFSFKTLEINWIKSHRTNEQIHFHLKQFSCSNRNIFALRIFEENEGMMIMKILIDILCLSLAYTR